MEVTDASKERSAAGDETTTMERPPDGPSKTREEEEEERERARERQREILEEQFVMPFGSDQRSRPVKWNGEHGEEEEEERV